MGAGEILSAHRRRRALPRVRQPRQACAGGGSLRLGADGRVDAKVRLDGVALGVEDIERIDLTGVEAEVVELDAHAGVPVYAADVDRQLLVDEHPDVVVTREREGLTAAVLEAGVDLGREVEVVYAYGA